MSLRVVRRRWDGFLGGGIVVVVAVVVNDSHSSRFWRSHVASEIWWAECVRGLIHSLCRIGAELSGVPGFPGWESRTPSVRSITSTRAAEASGSFGSATRLRRGWSPSDSSESEDIVWDVREKFSARRSRSGNLSHLQLCCLYSGWRREENSAYNTK